MPFMTSDSSGVPMFGGAMRLPFLEKKEKGCSRNTIRQAISNEPPKPSQLTHKKPAHVFGPYQFCAEALFHQIERLPRKQRYTAHRILVAFKEVLYCTHKLKTGYFCLLILR